MSTILSSNLNENENAFKSIEILRGILNTMPEIICLIDTRSCIVQCNNAFLNFIGKSRDLVINQELHNQLNDFAGYKEEYFRKVFSEQLIVSGLEVQFNKRYYNIYVDPLNNSNLKTDWSLFKIIDISHQKKNDNNTLSSWSILDNMIEGCAIIDFSWVYIYINVVNASHAHCTKEEILNRTIFQVFPGIEQSDFFSIYKKCLFERLPGQIEAAYKFPDGTVAWYETKVQPINEGILVLTADITGRKKTEESLQIALKQLMFHVENSPLGVIEFNSNYQIIQWSKTAEKVFGWKAKEVLGKKISDLKWVYEEDIEVVDNLSAEMFTAKNISNINSNRNYRKDGSVVTCEWYNSALTDSEGKLISVLSFVLDVTERNKALESLQKTMLALKRSNTDLEQFAYAASHDLQEPLRMISNYTRLLEKELKGKLDKRTIEFMDFIIDGSKRMNSLIQDLLLYSRISSQKEEFVLTNMNTILKDVQKDLELSIIDSKAVIKVETLPSVKANPVQMTQLFRNLILNAIKYKGEENPVIEIKGERIGKTLVFSIKDNGMGIESEYFEKIFVIFQRLHDRNAYPGTGIGLSLCKKIVENHGGRIWVESEPGKGSTFYFTINT